MQVVTCLTRDSYLTHSFLQHLMAVLSSLERTPSPEPVDKDFYSEFGNKTTGTCPAQAVLRHLASPAPRVQHTGALSSSLSLLSQPARVSHDRVSIPANP